MICVVIQHAVAVLPDLAAIAAVASLLAATQTNANGQMKEYVVGGSPISMAGCNCASVRCKANWQVCAQYRGWMS
jgi:hypothetical protein